MKKTIGIILALLVIVAIFGIGVFRFKFAVNDTSIGLDIGGASGANHVATTSPRTGN